VLALIVVDLITLFLVHDLVLESKLRFLITPEELVIQDGLGVSPLEIDIVLHILGIKMLFSIFINLLLDQLQNRIIVPIAGGESIHI
jgi:hypothetical protein